MKGKILLINCLMLVSLFVFGQTEVPDTLNVTTDLAKNAEQFSLGIENKYNENFDKAIDYFEKALEFNKDDDASMYELSELYTLKERHEEAFVMIEKAASLQPDNKWYQIRLAKFYLNRSDYQAFIDIYEKLIDAEPGNVEYYEDYIDVLLRIGEYEKVIIKLNQLEGIIGANEYISLQKIEIYKNLGNTKMMLQEMEHVVELAPTNTRYLSMLAEIYRQNKKDSEAYKLYMKIKEIEPNNPYINISLYDYYQSKGEIEKAFSEFVAAIKNPNLDYDTKVQIYEYWSEQNENSNISLTNANAEIVGNAFIEIHPGKNIGYYILGVVNYNYASYKKAQYYFSEAVKRDKKAFSSLYQLCLVDMELKDYKLAIEHASDAMTYYPEQPVFYLFSGLSYYNLKDYDNTVKCLEKGRKLSANKELTRDFDIYIGDTYNMLGNRKKSYEAYERVLRTDPENIYVLNNYAYYLSLDNDQLDKALEMSGKTIKAEPQNPTYIDTYAWVLYKMGRYQEAKKWMEKVFKYDKNPNGVNYEHLGDILYQLGDKKGALQNWKKAKKAGEASELIDNKIRDEKLYE